MVKRKGGAAAAATPSGSNTTTTNVANGTTPQKDKRDQNGHASTTASPSAANGRGASSPRRGPQPHAEGGSTTSDGERSGGGGTGADGRHTHRRRAAPHADAATQTARDDAAVPDVVEAFAGLREWRKMETLCELVQLLNPMQMRIVASCIQGTTSVQAGSLDAVEHRVNGMGGLEAANRQKSLPELRQMFLPSLSLLRTCNSQGAAAMINQLRRFYAELPALEAKGNREDILTECYWLLERVVPCMHMPAFSIDDRLAAQKMQRELLERVSRLEPWTATRKADGCHPTLKTIKCLDFDKDREEALLELSWTDGLITYTSRNFPQMDAFQRRLLDTYGMEERQDKRTLPYFPRHLDFLKVSDYFDRLSNLPARMLVDELFADEFKETRVFSSDMPCAPPRHSAVERRKRTVERQGRAAEGGVEDGEGEEALLDASTLCDVEKSEKMGVLPQVSIPSLPPPPVHASCPYCTGDHSFSHCTTFRVGPRPPGPPYSDYERIKCICCQGQH